MQEPLASQFRPRSLEDYVGQEHLVGPGKPIAVAIAEGHLFSFLLWGPPGVGKTTLARLYADAMHAEFFELSAVSAGKADVKAVVDTDSGSKPKILFLDEIHRFNKAQQDYLLPFVESGKLTLIGATTENPSFEVIPALLSRCRIFTLESLSPEAMERVLARVEDKENGGVPIPEDARAWLVAYAGGDARILLGVIDATRTLYKTLTVEHLQKTVQSKHLRYDKAGEEHYNTVSAFIKSMRAGQRDAAVYYLARMVEAGEDPLFIARRMVIFASEDVGLAQPTGLVVANAVFRACETVGYPECAISLAHGVAYLSGCVKDRRAYDALRAAQEDVRTHGNLAVPLHLRNAPTKLMKDLKYGEGYAMYDDKSYLPPELGGRTYFPRTQER